MSCLEGQKGCFYAEYQLQPEQHDKRQKEGPGWSIYLSELPRISKDVQQIHGRGRFGRRTKENNCSRRSKKWWHRLFYYLVDVSVVNSYILLSESPHCASRTQKEFILELSQELMGKFNARKRPPQPSGQVLPSARFDGNHYPETSDSLLQCHVCSQEGTRRRTRVRCSTCDPRNPIHLCIDPCFRIWHTEDK